MAWSPEDVAALERALATGARRVRYADREVEYRSLAEMEALLARLQREIAGTPRRSRSGVPVFQKGV